MMQERTRDNREPAATVGGTGDVGGFRTEAERLLALSGDVLERALSKDSTSFLAATRQQGGE